MYESDAIVGYLWKTYGNAASPPLSYKLASTRLSFVMLGMASMLRVFPEHGIIRIPSKKPSKPLELWSFEPSPFCKKVREVLSCLEIKYVLRNVARYSKPK